MLSTHTHSSVPAQQHSGWGSSRSKGCTRGSQGLAARWLHAAARLSRAQKRGKPTMLRRHAPAHHLERVLRHDMPQVHTRCVQQLGAQLVQLCVPASDLGLILGRQRLGPICGLHASVCGCVRVCECACTCLCACACVRAQERDYRDCARRLFWDALGRTHSCCEWA